ncbi:MAG: hypothetical protein JWO22_1352 [Frankiales bacterium]|nr:hypothetical protein [Frankiales bacterium]
MPKTQTEKQHVTTAPHEQQVTHVFIPLEDALDLPDGYVVELRDDPTRYESDTWLTDSHAGTLPASCLSECRLILRFWAGRISDVDFLGETYPAAARAIGQEPTPAAEHQTRSLSVVEIASARDIRGEQDLERLLDEGLHALRRWQRALHSSSGVTAMISTWEKLPPILVIANGTLRNGEYLPPDGLGLWVQERHPRHLAPAITIETAALDGIEHRLAAGEHTTFSAFEELRREAIISLRRGGDHRITLVMAAAASERLIEELYVHLSWEAGDDHDDVATELQNRREVLPRIGNWFAPLLGGCWDLNTHPPLLAWRDDVARLRNRVVHSGYEPTRHEAAAALAGLADLTGYFSERLSHLDICARYPLTAIVFIGTRELEARGCMSTRVRTAHDTAIKARLGEHARRFSAVVRRAVDARSGWPTPPAPATARSWLYAIADGSTINDWIIHDRDAYAAQRVPEPPLTEEQRHSLNTLPAALSAASGAQRHAIVVDAEHAGSDSGPWVPEHHLMPGTEISGPRPP